MNLHLWVAHAGILKNLLRWQASLLGGTGRQQFHEG